MFEPQSLEETVSLAHALETAALWLQAQAGCPVTFSRTTPTPEAGTYQVVVEYSQEEVGRLAIELAEQLIQSALQDDHPSTAAPPSSRFANSTRMSASAHRPVPSSMLPSCAAFPIVA